MPFGITSKMVAVGVMTFVLGAGLATLYYRWVALRIDEQVNELERKALENTDDEDASVGIQVDPPDVGRSVLDVFKVWLHLRKGSKLAKRGYMKWYRVGARLEKPTWVKPEHKGSGEYEHYSKADDQTYIFPEDSLITDGKTGAYVAIHKIGEAEPIPIRDPGWASMDADRLQTAIDMILQRDPPGMFDRFNISRGQLKMLGFGVLAIVVYFFTQGMGGA